MNLAQLQRSGLGRVDSVEAIATDVSISAVSFAIHKAVIAIAAIKIIIAFASKEDVVGTGAFQSFRRFRSLDRETERRFGSQLFNEQCVISKHIFPRHIGIGCDLEQLISAQCPVVKLKIFKSDRTVVPFTAPYV